MRTAALERLLTMATPEDMLAALATHDELEEPVTTAIVERLIRDFEPDRLAAAMRESLGDLSGAVGEVVLRVTEIVGPEALFEELAEALDLQADLPPERAWLAFSVLERHPQSIARRPALRERYQELEELIDGEEDAIQELADQIEHDPDGANQALDGLSRIDPETRAAILANLAELSAGPHLRAFLDRYNNGAAPVETMSSRSVTGDDRSGPPALRSRPRLVSSVVTSLDRRGRGEIILMAEERDQWIAAVFVCDMRHGVVDVIGEEGDDAERARELQRLHATRTDVDVVENAHQLAIGLLQAVLTLGRPHAPPTLDSWLKRLFGAAIHPAPFPAWDDESTTSATTAMDVETVLDACVEWIDESKLTYEIAEELLLRGAAPFEPERESGAHRYYFEKQLLGRVETDRRTLAWMGAFWQASGADELAKAARRLGRQLDDPQNIVPGHPFYLGFAARSINAAQARIRQRSHTEPRE